MQIYFYYNRNIILCNSYKDKKNSIINKNTTMSFNELEPKVQMSVCDQHIFVIHLSVYFSHIRPVQLQNHQPNFNRTCQKTSFGDKSLLKRCSMSFLLKGCKCEIMKTCITQFWPKEVVLDRNICLIILVYFNIP